MATYFGAFRRYNPRYLQAAAEPAARIATTGATAATTAAAAGDTAKTTVTGGPSLGSGLGIAANYAVKAMDAPPPVQAGVSGATLGASVGGVPGAIIGGTLGLLFGGGEESKPQLAPSPVHRNILPELQALADRYRHQRGR